MIIRTKSESREFAKEIMSGPQPYIFKSSEFSLRLTCSPDKELCTLSVRRHDCDSDTSYYSRKVAEDSLTCFIFEHRKIFNQGPKKS